MTIRGRLALVVAGLAAVAAAVLLWDRQEDPRSDALVRHIPDPSLKLSTEHPVEANDHYAALHDLIDPGAAAGFGADGVAPTEPGASSDVVGFWRGLGDQLTRAGVRPEYVEALKATYGTTDPRSFVSEPAATVAAKMITYLNSAHDEIYLVTEEEAAALQQIADQRILAAR